MSDRITTVQALLAKAESTQFEEERNALLAKAQELITRYGIEDAQLRMAGRRDETVQMKTIYMSGSYAKSHVLLACAISREVGCRVYFTPGKKPIKMTMAGFAEDLSMFEVLFTSLLMQVTRDRNTWAAQDRAERRFAAQRSFILGFATTVSARLAEARRRAEEEAVVRTTGVELALRTRDTELDDFMEAQGVKPGRRPANVQRQGVLAGQAAGRVADIGSTRLEDGRRKELSTR